MAKSKPVVPEELESLFGVGTRSAPDVQRRMSNKQTVTKEEAVAVRSDETSEALDAGIDIAFAGRDHDLRRAPEARKVGMDPALAAGYSAETQASPEVWTGRDVEYTGPGNALVGRQDCLSRVPAIYASLNAVHRFLAQQGLGKDQTNKTQGFKFRGIDALYNLISAELAKNHILTLPQMANHSIAPFTTKGGGQTFRATLHATYKFVSTIDGSAEYLSVFGEGMDSGDKATNKAMSIAHKYALIQAFNIPLVGSDDPDLESHEVEADDDPRQAPRKERAPAEPKEVDGDELSDIEAHIASLTKDPQRQQILLTKVLEAYGIMTLDQLPEERVDEAKAQLTSFVEAQKAKAAKGKK